MACLWENRIRSRKRLSKEPSLVLLFTIKNHVHYYIGSKFLFKNEATSLDKEACTLLSFKQLKNFSCHIFSSNIIRQNFLSGALKIYKCCHFVSVNLPLYSSISSEFDFTSVHFVKSLVKLVHSILRL